MADELNHQGKTNEISLTNVLPLSNKMKSKLINFSISSCSHSKPLKKAWVVQDPQLSTSPATTSSVIGKYSHLSEIPFDSPQHPNIKTLIGADHPNLHLNTEIKSGNNNDALNKTWAWTLFGSNQSTLTCPITNQLALDTSADSLIQMFLDIESYGTKPKANINVMTVNDKRAMEILQKTTTKCGFRLLWKKENVVLPNNKLLALSKLHDLGKNFAKDQNIKQLYTNVYH